MSGTRRSTINKRRQGALAVVLPWMRRFGIMLTVGVFGICIGLWLYTSGTAQKAGDAGRSKLENLTASMGFRAENFLVEGRVHADADTIVALLNSQKGSPLFSFDPMKAKELVEKMDWVKSAEVERRLPDTIYIRLKERTPTAFWQKDKALYLLDEEGSVIHTGGLSRFKDLMIVMGEEAPGHVPELLGNLHAEPEVLAHVTSAKWIDKRRWDLILKEGTTVSLPEEDAGLALRKLADAQRADGIFAKRLQGIDLRDSSRIILRTKPGVVEEYKAQEAALKTGSDI